MLVLDLQCMTMQSLAMRARRALAMPPGFDVRQRALFVFQHPGTGRFVRVGLRPLLAATREAERMLAKRAFERAAHWVPPAVEATYSGIPQQGHRSGVSVHALG